MAKRNKPTHKKKASKKTVKRAAAKAGEKSKGTGIRVVEDASPAAAAPPVELPASEGIQGVALEKIELDDTNHRLDEAADERKIAELAESFRSGAGQLQPIMVCRTEKAGRFRLVFGWRRCQAAKRAGLLSLRADLRPAMTEAQIEQARAVENLQRQDLNLIEESIAVGQLVAALRESGHDEAAAIGAAAVRLGKSETWVRDRGYLARLSGKARRLVIEGRLPLAHAREIAKLADPSYRDDIANMAARNEGGGGGWSIDQVRAHVATHVRSLKVVPWSMDAAFAGAPACAACPSNSANDPDLFEHDREKPPESGACLNERCFRRKEDAAQKALERGVSKVEELAKKKGEVPTGERGLVEAGLVPEVIKPGTFARQVKKAVAPADEPKSKRQAEPGGKAAPVLRSPREVAEVELERAESDWLEAAQEATIAAAKAKPGAVAALCLLMEGELYDALPQVWSRAKPSPTLHSLLARFASPTLELIAELEKLVETDRHSIFFERLIDLAPEGMELLASAVQADVPPRPTLEQFLPADEDRPKAKGKRKRKGEGAAEEPPREDRETAAREAGELADDEALAEGDA